VIEESGIIKFDTHSDWWRTPVSCDLGSKGQRSRSQG